MTKSKLIFLFIFIFLYTNGQITGTIYNELNLPVENASVFLLKDKDTLHTTISDRNGFFEFNNFSDKEDFVLIASHIGYETLRTRPAKEKVYFLASKQYLLDGVSVSSKKKAKKNTIKRVLGFIFNDVRNMSWEDELATFISPTPENKGKKIKSLKYQLADMRKIGVKNNKYQPFRACIYTVDTITGKPKEKIYRSEKVRMTKNEKWFYVHIDSLNIKMPKEGLFIVMEAITGKEHNYYSVAVRGGGSICAIPAIRVNVYNPNKSNKSYVKRNTNYNKKRDWELYNEEYYFCMEFEFEN